MGEKKLLYKQIIIVSLSKNGHMTKRLWLLLVPLLTLRENQTYGVLAAVIMAQMELDYIKRVAESDY